MFQSRQTGMLKSRISISLTPGWQNYRHSLFVPSKICVKMVRYCSSIILDKSFSFFPDKSHCISRLGWHMGRKLTACGQIYLPTCHLQIVLCSTLSSLIFPLVSEWKSPCRVCRLMVTRDLRQAKLTFLLLCWKKSFLCSTSTRGSLDKRWSR